MQLVNVKLSEVKEEFNPRADFSQVDELAKSIEAMGLLQPIVVRKNGEGFVLIDGACRLRALKKLGQKETQVRVIDAVNADEAQMAANLMRSDLNVIEKARGYERLIRTYPAKYSPASIAKRFGEKESSVKRMVSVAKRIPAALDGHLSQLLGQIDFEQLEILAQIPLGTMEKVIGNMDPKIPNIFSALGKFAKQLDWQCDALTTGKLVSAGRAFIVKRASGCESAWTTDESAYKEAKDAYEAKQKKAYGAEDKASREKAAEKTEKQKEADRAERKKEREAREAAVKALPGMFKTFVKDLVSEKDMDELGREVCEAHLDSDKCRRLWAAFGIAGCDKVSSYELRSKTWDKVFAPMVKTPQQVARLRTFLTLGWKEGKSPEQAWVDGMRKK